jgi:putative nucleotidyltransferase with HDIG domain
MRGVRHILVGQITIDEAGTSEAIGIAAAKKFYGQAVSTAEALWASAKAGEKPDPAAARTIIDSLSKLLTRDRTSLMALTALKKYDNYTFTHMVNVSILSMAQARSLDIDGPLLREFGVSALMHDIGKIYTPNEILNKPDVLTKEEFAIMQRHVIDGAHILRGTPEMPALAPIVAFEHHLKQDLSGYPTNIGHRELNLCTMVVSISDVYDALRSNRTYREGLATDRIRAIMGRKGDVSFNHKLLRRFINLIGLYPIGTLVRLNTNELAVVTHEHPGDPFRPQVRVVRDREGAPIERPPLANTWEREPGKDYARAVVEAVNAEALGIDPLQYM